ncbi:hypothetical protein [Paenibacillus koleovorans]|uniref:hypothetical protein n=1 Tax=Paenibacillus koleovorans TaxID=121608 RepID=UPI000FDC0322|nr:hypothetical protein [Paenibacillus koleovorans]
MLHGDTVQDQKKAGISGRVVLPRFPFEEHLLQLEDEEIIWLHGKAFVISPATEDDIERIGKGFFCMD